MADSPGTWQIGTDSAATIAASEFGQWSPTDPDPDNDTWANADGSFRPVSMKALKRGITQLSEIADGTRTVLALDVTGTVSCESVTITEAATVPGGAPSAGSSRLWVRNDAPNVLVFTDDAGTDHDVTGAGAAGSLDNVLVAGNTTGGTNLEVTNGDAIVGEDGGSISFAATTGRITLSEAEGTTLYLAGADSGDAAAGADELVVGDGSAADVGLTLYTGSANAGNLRWTDTAGAYQGAVYYDHSTNVLGFETSSGTLRATISNTGIAPAATDTYDLGVTATRWRTAWLSTRVVVPLVVGGDFGTGTGAGTALTVRGGDGGTTGGAGGAATFRGGHGLAGATDGGDAVFAGGDATGVGTTGTATLRSGNAQGPSGDASDVILASGTVFGGDLGVIQIPNTCLEIRETTSMPGRAITAGYGRFGVRNTTPSRPMYQDDAGDTHAMLLTAPQNGALAQEVNVSEGSPSVSATVLGIGYPTASSQITAADFVDYLGTNASPAPTINSYVFSTIAGAGGTLDLTSVEVNLNTNSSNAPDTWALILRTTTHGDILIARITLVP